MIRILGALIALAVLVNTPLSAKRPVNPGQINERILAIVPMIGQGTLTDPRRPAYVPAQNGRADSGPDLAGIIGFRMVLSDDGRFALVEFVALDRSAFADLLADRRPEVRIFEKGRTRREDIETEFRKLRKEFELEQLTGGRR
jgi:hypothetical protein